MKRIASAAAAATLSLSLVAGPAFAAEANTQPNDKDAKVGSSVAYAQCKAKAEAAEKKKAADSKTAGDLAKTKAEQARQEAREELTSSSDELDCVKELINDKDYKAGILGLLIGVPAAIVALLGVAGAAVAGVIPGVELPALPF